MFLLELAEMGEVSKSLVITGYTSKIAEDFVAIALARNQNLQILRCGRRSDADFQVDFSSYDQTRAFVNWLIQLQPDYLFVNHGMLPGKRLNKMHKELIDETLGTNLVSFLMILEELLKCKNLRTVVTSSVSGKAGSFDTLYASCKAGVDLTIKSIAKLVPSNSRLNAVSPGIIADAGMTLARTDHDTLATKCGLTPTRHFTTSKDVAGLVYYILFESENIQGENININGGIFIT